MFYVHMIIANQASLVFVNTRSFALHRHSSTSRLITPVQAQGFA